jgi:predicted cupin superfamily sugar epimerase
MQDSGRDWIERLGLAPHPEGGWYRETFRSTERVTTADGRLRPATTLIHYALFAGETSAWHRVAGDEAWIHCDGAPLELTIVHRGLSKAERVQLASAAAPHHVVPGGAWQMARSLGSGSLVSCSVAPGFEFADFELLRDLPDELAEFRRRFPRLAWGAPSRG